MSYQASKIARATVVTFLGGALYVTGTEIDAFAVNAYTRVGIADEAVVNIETHGGRCLDLDHGKKENGVRIQQWTCNGTEAQKWRMTQTSDSSFEIRSVVSDKCLEVEDSSGVAGAAVQQWKCTGGKQMHWQLVATDVERQEFQLRPMHTTDRCLDIENYTSGNGAKAQQWYCNQTDPQFFRIRPSV
ncbi:RICIN domain-containing protein [Streptomyces syringium]|uniref:RICIN domain-containing protein n=1 Tax=Streptomyces syringium TaxID=76729 RepID=UPI0034532AC3